MAVNFGLNLKKEILCVDLGKSSIKVLKLTRKGTEVVAEEFVLAETGFDPDLSHEEFQKKRGEILASIWKEHKFKAKDILLSIPGSEAMPRQIKIPRVTGDRLDRIVRFEAKQQIPIPLDQAILDYHTFDTDSPEVEVALIAYRRNVIEDCVQVLREAKLRPDVIEAAPLSLFNALTSTEPEPGEVIALIDIGASETNIVIHQDRMIKFVRTARVGGNQITEAIAQEMDVSFAEAEEKKLSIGVIRGPKRRSLIGQGDREEAARIAESAIDKILNAIRLSIDFYISKPDGEALTRVVLSGGTSRLEGLDDLISERLGVPVEKCQPFAVAGVDASKVEADGLNEVASIVMGLALRAGSKAILEMNFIPPSVKESKAIRQRMVSLIIQGFLLLLTVLAVVLHVKSELQKYKEANNFLEAVLRGGDVLGKQAQALMQERDRMDQRFDKLKGIANQRGRLAKLLFEIARIAPPEIWLVEFQGTQRNIVITGRCEAQEASKLNDFMDVLTLNPYFGADPNSVRCESQRPVGDALEFRIAISKLSTPNPDEVKLIQALVEKKVDFLFARLTKLPGNKACATITMYGEEDREKNNANYPTVVDAMISSEAKFERINMVWVNRLRKTMYEQKGPYEVCLKLQKDEIGLDEFLKGLKVFEPKEEPTKPPEGQQGKPGQPPGQPPPPPRRQPAAKPAEEDPMKDLK